MLVALTLAAVVDVALAVLLVAVSGFVFGGGPEGANGEATAVAIWLVGFTVCLVAPMAGFGLWKRKLGGWGVLVALVPSVAGAVFMGI